MTVYVVFGHDDKGAWIEAVYTSYDEARKAELIAKRGRRFGGEFYGISKQEVVEPYNG